MIEKLFELLKEKTNKPKLAYNNGYQDDFFILNKNNVITKIEESDDFQEDLSDEVEAENNTDLEENEIEEENNIDYDENNSDDENIEINEPKTKNRFIQLILRDPKTYLILAIVIAILFIIGLIIVLFSNTPIEPTLRVLCGGPSKLDNLIVITNNENGDPIEHFDFYNYISHKVYADIGFDETYFEHNNPIEAYQAQAIATVSKVLNQQYHEDILKANLEKYNNWCSEDNEEEDDENVQINCMTNITDDIEILILESEMINQEKCNSLTGCYHWENKDYEELFGIEDGECINMYQSLYGKYLGTIIEKYCPINVTLTEEEIEELEQDYDFKKDDDGVLYLLVKAESIFENLDENKEKAKDIISYAVDTVRGVLMVHRDGSPALTEYTTTINEEPACYANVSGSSPANNVMCSTIDNTSNYASLNIFNQALILKWPVHKILTYWYDYYFASWSESGRRACELYSPRSDSIRALNLDETAVANDEIHKRPDPEKTKEEQTKPDLIYYDMDYASDLLNTFAYLKNRRNQKIISKYEVPVEIKDLTRHDIEDDFNRHIRDAVKSRGIGSGTGVAMATITLLNYMEEEGFRLPYSLGEGFYHEYGVNPNWGKEIEDKSSYWAQEAVEAWDDYFPGIKHTIPKGMDCSQFVMWSLKNGGITGIKNMGKYHFWEYQNDAVLSRQYNGINSNVGWFGDPLWRSPGGEYRNPHGKIVIGVVFDINNVLVGNKVAESSGLFTGAHVSNISVINGELLKKEEVHSGGSETEDPVIIGYTYTETATEEGKPPYSLIDFQSCYNQKNPDLCTIDSDENFFKGKVLEKPEYVILEE